jgi:hypothetical protein
MQLTFLDEPVKLEPVPGFDTLVADWPAIHHHVRYRGASATGIDHAPAAGGWVVHPASTVLALPGFEDAFEVVVAGELHTLFDVEKIVRMLLHDSHLALEILGSAASFDAAPVSRDILAWTLNTRHLAAARDAAKHLASGSGIAGPDDALEQARRYLQGAALARGDLSLNLEVLAGRFGLDVPRDLDSARAVVDMVPLLPDRPALPDSPADYDRLSDWLVAQRLEMR